MRELIIYGGFFFVAMPVAYFVLEWLFVDKHDPGGWARPPRSPEDEASDAVLRAYYERMKDAPPTSPEQRKRQHQQRVQEWQSQWNRFEHGPHFGQPPRNDGD